MSEDEIKPVAWMVDEQGMTGQLCTKLYWARNGGTPPSFGQNHSPLYDQSAIDRLTAERDDALAAAASKAGWEWMKRAAKAEAERDEAQRKLSVAVAERKACVAETQALCNVLEGHGADLPIAVEAQISFARAFVKEAACD